MRIFVASWFFPPNTSAEGLVTFKLLKYSQNEYDVCCSKSKNWSYEKDSNLEAKNIHIFPVDTDDISKWVQQCIEIFKENHNKKKYDCIMTRSMPPESIIIGDEIKKIDKNIKWIASFGDPIYRNPYEMEVYIKQDRYLSRLHLNNFFMNHMNYIPFLLGYLPISKFKLLKRLYQLEKTAMKKADYVICPSKKQMEYLLKSKSNRKYKEKCHVIPHSYDLSLYPEQYEQNKHDEIVISYIGYMDKKRMPKEIFRILAEMKKKGEIPINKLKIKLIGNITEEVSDMVEALFLEDIIMVQGSVDYLRSLEVMLESDYLLHIDAQFDFLEEGSIFLASKVIDYIGSGSKIIALTERYSESARIISEVGGILWERGNQEEIERTIVEIINNVSIKEKKRCDKYLSRNIAQNFDKMLVK